MKNVPYFNYPYVFKSHESQFVETLTNVGRRGAFIMQKELVEFEIELAKYTGSKFAVGVSNATDGLQIALIAGGIKNGDEVIFCSHTMVATAAAIHFAGGKPVPVDAGQDHLIDIKSIESAITDKTKAICPTQLNGRTSDMESLMKIAEKYQLDIYEDAAQALGSKYNGKAAGTFGKASCISFYPAKLLGCLGDGGAVLTSDPEIHRKLLMLRDHGRNAEGDVEMWGFNCRLDNVEAAYLSFQFKEYQKTIDRRRAIAKIYNDELTGIDEIVLPPSPYADQKHFDVYQNYEIEADDRNNLKNYLSQNGIGTLIQWGGKAVHQFKGLGFNLSLPKTEQLFQRLLMLPMNLSLSDSDVLYVCDKIKTFYLK